MQTDGTAPDTAPIPDTTSRRNSRLGYHALALVAAVLSAGVILEASWEQGSSVPKTAPLAIEASSVVGVLNAGVTAEGVHNVSRQPMTADLALGPVVARAFDLTVPASVLAEGDGGSSAASDNRLAQAESATETSMKTGTLAGRCPHGCRSRPAATTVAVLPPPRVAEPVTVATLAPAPPLPQPEERVRLLGVKLPGFVPTGATIVKGVVSVGSAVADLANRI